MTAIDQDCEPDGARPAELAQRIHRRPNRSSGVEHVIDEDRGRAANLEWQIGALHDGRMAERREVVAVEGDVERPDGEPDALVLQDRRRQAMGQWDSPALDADEDQAVRAGLLLDDLVGDANHGSADLIRGHDPTAAHGAPSGLTGPARRLSWPVFEGRARV